MASRTIEAKILFLALAALLTTEVGAILIVRETTCSPMLIQGVVRAVQAVLLLLIFSVWGKGLASIGLAQDQIVGGLKKGAIWSAGFGICVILGFAALHVAGIDPLKLVRTPLPPTHKEILLTLTVGGLVAPIAEEVFFRGILYGFLRRWGVFVALFGSTVIFVLAHAITSRIPVTQTVGGILFAVAYEVEGNLIVPITIHVLGNLAIFALSLVP
jgi:membrane protease YdiL (CAAX protease family)